VPEVPFQFDQAGNQALIAFDTVDFEMLTTEQNGDIRRLLAGDGELVHDLELNVFGYAFLPELCPIDAGRLAFEDLYLAGTGDFAVNVGQHPRQIRIGMLQDSVDAPYPIAGAFGVVGCDDWFKDIAPVSRALFIVWIGLGQRAITTGLLHPQFELALVRVQANRCCGIRTTDALLANGQPILAGQFLGLDQFECRTILGRTGTG